MKQNTKTVKAPKIGVIKSNVRTRNYDQVVAYSRDDKSELFLLGVGRFFGESSFYEEHNIGRVRYAQLIHSVTQSDHEWVAGFLKWLRNDSNIRTAAIVGAAEYVKAGGPNGRTVVFNVLSRADEPAELLAYWIKTYGKHIPQPIKRGIADRTRMLYTERNFARWDSKTNAVRMADVVELTHPKPSGTHQSQLFQYMIEDRHGRGNLEDKFLDDLAARAKAVTRKDYIDLLEAGNRTVSWENVSSAEQGPMSAEQWLAVYPHMGYMAKLRNLNNLDRANVAVKVKREIGEWLADPENVATSKQLPLRFYSAYRTVGDDVWKSYLSGALENSLKNVPTIKGKWLVLVDASASMFWGNSERSKVSPYENACVFAAVFAKNNDADVRTYSLGLSPKLPTHGKNTLRLVADLGMPRFKLGSGTSTSQCLDEAFRDGKYDHVLLITDEQYNGYSTNPSDSIPQDVPLYTFNVGGYQTGHSTGMNRVTVGGLSDSAFSMISAVESAKAKWPWE